MMTSDRARNALIAAVAASIISGCASQSNPAVPQTSALATMVLPQAGPPACKGQKTTKTDSTDDYTLSSKGGAFCIPSFHGLGGALGYPAANPSGKVTVTSTTENINKFPNQGTGTATFYMEIGLAAATSFGSKLPPATGLTGATIKAKSDYSVFSAYLKYGFWYAGQSCYAVAKTGKYGGILAGLGKVLVGQSFGGPYTILLEVYPGKQSSTIC